MPPPVAPKKSNTKLRAKSRSSANLGSPRGGGDFDTSDFSSDEDGNQSGPGGSGTGRGAAAAPFVNPLVLHGVEEVLQLADNAADVEDYCRRLVDDLVEMVQDSMLASHVDRIAVPWTVQDVIAQLYAGMHFCIAERDCPAPSVIGPELERQRRAEEGVGGAANDAVGIDDDEEGDTLNARQVTSNAATPSTEPLNRIGGGATTPLPAPSSAWGAAARNQQQQQNNNSHNNKGKGGADYHEIAIAIPSLDGGAASAAAASKAAVPTRSAKAVVILTAPDGSESVGGKARGTLSGAAAGAHTTTSSLNSAAAVASSTSDVSDQSNSQQQLTRQRSRMPLFHRAPVSIDHEGHQRINASSRGAAASDLNQTTNSLAGTLRNFLLSGGGGPEGDESGDGAAAGPHADPYSERWVDYCADVAEPAHIPSDSWSRGVISIRRRLFDEGSNTINTSVIHGGSRGGESGHYGSAAAFASASPNGTTLANGSIVGTAKRASLLRPGTTGGGAGGSRVGTATAGIGRTQSGGKGTNSAASSRPSTTASTTRSGVTGPNAAALRNARGGSKDPSTAANATTSDGQQLPPAPKPRRAPSSAKLTAGGGSSSASAAAKDASSPSEAAPSPTLELLQSSDDGLLREEDKKIIADDRRVRDQMARLRASSADLSRQMVDLKPANAFIVDQRAGRVILQARNDRMDPIEGSISAAAAASGLVVGGLTAPPPSINNGTVGGIVPVKIVTVGGSGAGTRSDADIAAAEEEALLVALEAMRGRGGARAQSAGGQSSSPQRAMSPPNVSAIAANLAIDPSNLSVTLGGTAPPGGSSAAALAALLSVAKGGQTTTAASSSSGAGKAGSAPPRPKKLPPSAYFSVETRVANPMIASQVIPTGGVSSREGDSVLSADLPTPPVAAGVRPMSRQEFLKAQKMNGAALPEPSTQSQYDGNAQQQQQQQQRAGGGSMSVSSIHEDAPDLGVPAMKGAGGGGAGSRRASATIERPQSTPPDIPSAAAKAAAVTRRKASTTTPNRSSDGQPRPASSLLAKFGNISTRITGAMANDETATGAFNAYRSGGGAALPPRPASGMGGINASSSSIAYTSGQQQLPAMAGAHRARRDVFVPNASKLSEQDAATQSVLEYARLQRLRNTSPTGGHSHHLNASATASRPSSAAGGAAGGTSPSALALGGAHSLTPVVVPTRRHFKPIFDDRGNVRPATANSIAGAPSNAFAASSTYPNNNTASTTLVNSSGGAVVSASATAMAAAGVADIASANNALKYALSKRDRSGSAAARRPGSARSDGYEGVDVDGSAGDLINSRAARGW